MIHVQLEQYGELTHNVTLADERAAALWIAAHQAALDDAHVPYRFSQEPAEVKKT